MLEEDARVKEVTLCFSLKFRLGRPDRMSRLLILVKVKVPRNRHEGAEGGGVEV
jgi:hypothetical protein